MTEWAIECRQVSKTYRYMGREIRALDAISLEVPAGSAYGLCGENGSGKSTLARLILGLERPDAGQALVWGRDVARRSRRDRREWPSLVQTIWQDPQAYLTPSRTAAALIREPMRGTEAGKARRLADLLDLVGLPRSVASRRPFELSGGECQRVAWARALAVGPRLLILDEALSGLDLPLQWSCLDALAAIRQATGLTILFISHDLAFVSALCSEVAILNSGALVDRGPVPRVLGNPRQRAADRLVEAHWRLSAPGP